jgi:hypothetical protein
MWQDLIVCGLNDNSDAAKFALYHHQCEFHDFIVLISHLINDMVVVSTLVATGVLMYFGIRLITAQGDTGVMKTAKNGLFNVVKGYAVIIIAWVLVYTIMNVLVGPAYSLLGNPK